ncbi:alpha/beta hydrolase fold domain-containing protein [Actinoplanes sp. NPDC000266]
MDYTKVSAGGVPAMWLSPHGAARDRVIVAFHGGGFVGGSLYTHRTMYGHLAKAAGVRVLLATYRLAPAFRFPARVEDAVTAYRWAAGEAIGRMAACHEAEDAVRETYVRALRGWAGFQGRSSVRTWLCWIATNVCLTVIEGRGRDALVPGASSPRARELLAAYMAAMAWWS